MRNSDHGGRNASLAFCFISFALYGQSTGGTDGLDHAKPCYLERSRWVDRGGTHNEDCCTCVAGCGMTNEPISISDVALFLARHVLDSHGGAQLGFPAASDPRSETKLPSDHQPRASSPI